ncbi:MAG: apolipoprotein N-acyltransferase [Rhizobiales bacterium]|nr:apolipoprotein N-acyltransferase [Hyphomicrobiales bacterium]
MSPIDAVLKAGHSFVLLSGWRAHGVSVLIGAISAAALPPLFLFPILWVTFPVLVLMLDGASPNPYRRGVFRLMPAFSCGYWFGFGYFVAGLWWLGGAFLVDAEKFAWLMPFAIIGLPLGLSVFFGLATASARLFWAPGAPRLLALAACLATFEWLRGTILTGFPWNSLGSLLSANDVMMQGLSLVGLPVYHFLSVLIFASPVLLLDADQDRRGARRMLSAALVVFGALAGFGFARLATATAAPHEGVRLRIIQPDIPQANKFSAEFGREVLDRYLEMSARKKEPGDLGLLAATHLIWPESAFPFLLTENPEALSAIADLLPQGTTLITGAVRSDPRGSPGHQRNFYNSLYVIGHDGLIRDAYDKVHLVPFGEYLPFGEIVEKTGLLPIIELPGGFTAGVKQRVMRAGSAPPFLPLICYEVIFPQEDPAPDATQKPEWILNLTNDAWFGLTSGPYQHFHQSKMRAAEEGLPVVRVANNGISAVIDGYGRTQSFLPLGGPGILDADLPPMVALPVADPWKRAMFWTLIIVAFVVCFWSAKSRRRMKAG